MLSGRQMKEQTVAKQEVGHPKLVVQCFSDSSLIGLSVHPTGRAMVFLSFLGGEEG